MNVGDAMPPGFDGGNPAVERSQRFFGMSCIPTNVGKDTERVKELLRIVDYCTAPFGSEEYTFLRWGLQGVHYDLQNGAPIQNDRGRTDIGALSSGIGRRNDVFYFPDAPEDARLLQQWCKDQLAFGIENPTYGAVRPATATHTPSLGASLRCSTRSVGMPRASSASRNCCDAQPTGPEATRSSDGLRTIHSLRAASFTGSQPR